MFEHSEMNFFRLTRAPQWALDYFVPVHGRGECAARVKRRIFELGCA